MSAGFVWSVAKMNSANGFDVHDKSAMRRHRLLTWLLPVVVGGVAYAFKIPFAASALQVALPILTSLSFGVLVYVFQLRLDAKSGRSKGDRLLALLDAVFHNIVYSILVGFACIIIGIIAAVFDQGLLGRMVSGGGFALTTHYFLVLLLVIRRLWSAYNVLTC